MKSNLLSMLYASTPVPLGLVHTHIVKPWRETGGSPNRLRRSTS